jgi:ATP-binding cassette subfamily B protein
MRLVLMTGTSVAVAFLFTRIGNFTYRYLGIRTMRLSYEYAFQKITNHSYLFFSNHFTGSLVSKSKRFAHGIKSIIHIALTTFWMTFVFFCTTFVILFFQSPKLSWILLVWSLIYMLIMYKLVKIQLPYGLRRAAADSKVGGRLSDVFTNMFTLKVFSARTSEMQSFATIVEDEAFHRNKAWYVGNRQKAIKSALMLSFQTLMLYIVLKMWVAGEVSTGMIVLVQSYVLTLLSRLWDMDEALSGFMENVAEIDEAIDLFETKPDILDPETPEVSRMQHGNITCKNVSFVYESGKAVFQNFNLSICAGEKVGLVGYSGAGKSTITKLLLRFLDVTSGSIEIDGQNIKNVLQDDLRRAIAYVPQEPILFHRTIRENIAYGKPNATEEEIISAAKRAHAHEFISTLKQGYDTLVGERGVKLSGGERQRVAIARVMLTAAPILILDEATSSLDSVSESYIQDAFEELMKGRTTIVIAHRLSTIQKMDRIIVLEEGGIKEEGTHKELLTKDGIYADLWNHQTGGFLEDQA